MKELIDLYSKLLIGTFTFIGPSFTLFIPIFYKALDKSIQKHQAKLKNLEAISREAITDGNIEELQKRIKEGNKQLKQLSNQAKRELDLLRPKRQMRRLFIGLFVSITTLAFYHFQHSHFWKFESQLLRFVCLFVSGLSFVYCLRVLWQVFCTIINIRTEEEKLNNSTKMKVAA